MSGQESDGIWERSTAERPPSVTNARCNSSNEKDSPAPEKISQSSKPNKGALDHASLLRDPEFGVWLVIVIPHRGGFLGIEKDQRIHGRDVTIAKKLIVIFPMARRIKCPPVPGRFSKAADQGVVTTGSAIDC